MGAAFCPWSPDFDPLFIAVADGSEASPDDRQPKPKTSRQQLAVALTMLKPSARQSLGKTPSKSSEHII